MEPAELKTDPINESILKVNTGRKFHARTRCTRCDNQHSSSDPTCPAKMQKCRSCGVVGHFARCCFLKKKKARPTENAEIPKKKRFVREVHETVPENNEDDVFDLFHLGGKRTAKIDVGGVPVAFVIDTGADEDILSEEDWRILKNVGFEAYTIKKGSSKTFNSYGSNKPLTVLGEVETDVKYDGKTRRTKFFVIRDGRCSLLSGNTAVELGLLKFLFEVNDGAFPCINDGLDVEITATPQSNKEQQKNRTANQKRSSEAPITEVQRATGRIKRKPAHLDDYKLYKLYSN
ncbi:uncharacterized protein LOC134223156 [Armigeres subalbatus]|uniref:uncharacterized protein LOC134223156 n=1 Tax=Armigeres subalbatus TaxID=124917 RepID=UPI002ED25C32